MATKEILKFELIKFNNKSYQVSAIVFNVIHHMLSVIRKNIKYITLCFNDYKKLSSILDAKMFSDEIQVATHKRSGIKNQILGILTYSTKKIFSFALFNLLRIFRMQQSNSFYTCVYRFKTIKFQETDSRMSQYNDMCTYEIC